MSNLSIAAKQFQRHYDTLITGDIHPVEHPVAKGDAREHGWRELFRRFFPNLYGIKSGFVIDSVGNLSQQIDCIIYRKDMGIELYSVGHHTVIPVEAVFGAFEIKPTMTAKTLNDAKKKAASIANLQITNNLVWKSNGQLENYLSTSRAENLIIMGLLVDKIDSENKWKVRSFKKSLGEFDSRLSVFMTVEDGCADTLSTGHPTKNYTFYGGNHALLNQLIRLAEGVSYLEQARCLQSCCLTEYKKHLTLPVNVRI